MNTPLTVLLATDRSADVERLSFEASVQERFSASPGIALHAAPSIYDLGERHEFIEWLKTRTGPVVLLTWLYPRSAYWTLRALGVDAVRRTVTESDEAAATSGGRFPLWCVDLKEHADADAVAETLDRIRAAASSLDQDSDATPPPTAASDVRRWYPVIDFERCTNCLECLNFCLFGVYSVDQDEHLLIEQPDACRNGCPACSRICPAGAIMFPAHDDPAIAGDERAAAEDLKLDLSQIFSGLGGDALSTAESERDRALQAMRGEPSKGADLDQLVDELDESDL